MNEMNGKYTIEVLKEATQPCWLGGSKASYQRGLITGLLLRGVFIGTPFFRR